MKYKLTYGKFDVDILYLFKGIYSTTKPFITKESNLESLLLELLEFLPITETFKNNLFECQLTPIINE